MKLKLNDAVWVSFALFVFFSGSYINKHYLRFSLSDSVGTRIWWRVPCSTQLTRWQLVEISINNKNIPKGKKLAKRIGCFPGERIQRKGLDFYCNNSYENIMNYLGSARMTNLKSQPLHPWLLENYPEEQEILIPENEYYMFGNSPFSYDSRYIGLISNDKITSCLLELY
jgi:type IV secretory pathway protease TraF